MSGPAAPILRVASVPAGHPYVAHLGLGDAGIALLDDPRPPGAPPGRWWPPVMLDAAWIAEHAGRFDVLHLHFGTESLSIAALSRALDALARARRPWVYTVHDLVNPQLADQRHHLAQLDLLIPRASELITLTAGAADEIARRWGRSCEVIAHPRMLSARPPLAPPAARSEADRTGAGAPQAPAFTVGVHLRDLRPGIDGPGTAAGLAGAIRRLRADGLDARGRIVLFDRVRDAAQAAAVHHAAAGVPELVVVQAPRLSDAALVAQLSALDVSLLPYRHGTHSGWAELCWDLGVAVLGAPVGYVAEQHTEPGWFSATDPTDPVALADVLRRLAHARPDAASSPPGPARKAVTATRRAQRDARQPALAQAHRDVYLRARPAELGG